MKRVLDYDVVKKDLEEFPDETVRARAKRLGCNQNTLGQYILDLRDPSRKVANSKKIHEAMRKTWKNSPLLLRLKEPNA